MKETLEKLKLDDKYINDIYINNNQEWCIVWDTNSYKTSFPSQMFDEHMKQAKNENKRILSIAFNNNGQHIILTHDNFFCSEDEQGDFLHKAYELYGLPLSISLTTTSMVVCCENGVYTKGIPQEITTIINENINFRKVIRFSNNGVCLLTDGLRIFTHNL